MPSLIQQRKFTKIFRMEGMSEVIVTPVTVFHSVIVLIISLLLKSFAWNWNTHRCIWYLYIMFPCLWAAPWEHWLTQTKFILYGCSVIILSRSTCWCEGMWGKVPLINLFLLEESFPSALMLFKKKPGHVIITKLLCIPFDNAWSAFYQVIWLHVHVHQLSW